MGELGTPLEEQLKWVKKESLAGKKGKGSTISIGVTARDENGSSSGEVETYCPRMRGFWECWRIVGAR